MKKNIYLILVLILISSIFVGCGSKETTKTHEDLSGKSTLENEVDMKHMNAIYEFVNGSIVDITRENFNNWEVYYFDITGSGTDEVLFVSPYDADWHDRMEIISGDGGEYKKIPSEIYLTKNGNNLIFQEGFLIVYSKTSGSGMQTTYKDYYIFNDSRMENVLDSLVLEYEVSAPDVDYTETAEIDGDYKDFIYTLTRYDNETGAQTIEKKERYIYNSDTMRFDIIPPENQDTDGENGKGFSFNINNGNLSITIADSGSTTTIKANEDGYDWHKRHGDDITKYSGGFREILSAKKSHDGSALYFTTEAMEGIYPVTYVLDISTMKIYWITEGEFVMDYQRCQYCTYAVLERTFNGETEYSVYDVTAYHANEWIVDLGNNLEQDIKAQIEMAIDEAY